MGLGPRRAEVEHDALARRAGHLSRHGGQHCPPYALLHPYGAARHLLRLHPRPDADSLCHPPRELPVERTGDVPPQARRVPLLAGHRRLLDAVAQAARGPRVPPRRAVQQPRPGRHPRAELPARTAGVDHRPALHALLGDGGRRRDVRDADVVVRARTAALLHAGLPRHGARGRRAAQHRQVVLRLLPRLHTRPLRAGLPALLLRLRALRSRGVEQRGALRLAQPLRLRHHARGAGQVLRHERLAPLPRDLRRFAPPLGFASRAGRQRAVARPAARGQPHHLPLAAAAGRHGRAGAQGGFRPPGPLRAGRYPYGRGTHGLLRRVGLDASGPCGRAGLVDRIPALEALRAAGQLAALLHEPRRRPSAHLRRAAQRALSHRCGRRCAGVGRIQPRRPLHGGAPPRGARGALRHGGAHRDSRTGVG